eukprot:2714557-Rhodomonas_salina.1
MKNTVLRARSNPVIEIEALRKSVLASPLYKCGSFPVDAGSPKPADPSLFDNFFGRRVTVESQPQGTAIAQDVA